jgi:hypothetical protein
VLPAGLSYRASLPLGRGILKSVLLDTSFGGSGASDRSQSRFLLTVTKNRIGIRAHSLTELLQAMKKLNEGQAVSAGIYGRFLPLEKKETSSLTQGDAAIIGIGAAWT